MTKAILQINPIGHTPWATIDPFLFCVYHKDAYPKGNDNLGVDAAALRGRNIGQDFALKDGFRMYHGTNVPGFPYHPHRGFETITVTEVGLIDHSDSLGAAGRFGQGDVQWMTAGKGVQHSEMFPLLHQDQENPLEFFQIWLNLPRKSKFVEPHFRMLWNDMIPVVSEKDANERHTQIRVIAGSYLTTNAPAPTPDSWAADPENAVTILTIKMEAKAKWTLPALPFTGASRILYFYKGDKLSIQGETVSHSNLIAIHPNQDITIENGEEAASLLMLQGKPINEPVVQHGPFVMNSQEEIMQAFEDYRRTQFGGWPWPQQEQVHGKEKGRFALYADGTEEVR